ncbi:MAG: OmpH family outer membrane protein [Magnetovibrionaceae bacterium]
MKKLLMAASLGVALFLSPFVTEVQAQEEPKGILLRVAIVDMEAISRTASVFKDVRRQLQDLRKEISEEVQKEEAAIREANQELARKRTLMTPDAFAEERRKFEQSVATFQQSILTRRRAVEKVEAETMRKLQGTLIEIITEIANENELTLILSKRNTILVAAGLEITNVVRGALDERLPSLVVQRPEL